MPKIAVFSIIVVDDQITWGYKGDLKPSEFLRCLDIVLQNLFARKSLDPGKVDMKGMPKFEPRFIDQDLIK